MEIPTLPKGKQLVINIRNTWGDRHYVGLNGIEVFTDCGKPAEIVEVSDIVKVRYCANSLRLPQGQSKVTATAPFLYISVESTWLAHTRFPVLSSCSDWFIKWCVSNVIAQHISFSRPSCDLLTHVFLRFLRVVICLLSCLCLMWLPNVLSLSRTSCDSLTHVFPRFVRVLIGSWSCRSLIWLANVFSLGLVSRASGENCFKLKQQICNNFNMLIKNGLFFPLRLLLIRQTLMFFQSMEMTLE